MDASFTVTLWSPSKRTADCMLKRCIISVLKKSMGDKGWKNLNTHCLCDYLLKNLKKIIIRVIRQRFHVRGNLILEFR